MAARKCLSTDDEFRQAVAASLSVRQMLSCIGLVPAGGNYKTVHTRIARLALDTSHFTGAAWNQGARYKSFGRKATSVKFWLRTHHMRLLTDYVDACLKRR